MKDLLNKLDQEQKQEFSVLITSNINNPTLNMIIADRAENTSDYRYDNWFQSSFEADTFIWCGSGLSDQFFLRPEADIAFLRSKLPPNGGFKVVAGHARIVRFISAEAKE